MAQFLDNQAFATQSIPAEAYAGLRRSLLALGSQASSVLISEAELPPRWCEARGWDALVLVVTATAQGLLVKHLPPVADSPAEPCTVGLLTDAQQVATVLADLLAVAEPEVCQQLLAGQKLLSDRAPASGDELFLSLMPSLLANDPAPDSAPDPVTVESVQNDLDEQLERNFVLNQVITKIRQSLDLKSILSTTVEEVRQYLQADRLLIYQFRSPDGLAAAESMADDNESPTATGKAKGYVTYESLASSDIDSVLNFTEGQCFEAYAKQHQKYLNGKPTVVEDIEEKYRDSPCLRDFLRRAQVRAKVVIPILNQENLWGLLIVHHCHTPCQWNKRELKFLQHIAEHLSIAIKQAELYEQLQVQTHSLESCVIARTQDLGDALIAAQTANLAKSEFLATMSHELRTPLTCIIGMSATLLRWSFGELSPRQRSYLTTIHESGEQLLALINDILEMAKIESGRTALEVRSFSLSHAAQQSIEPFRRRARDHNLELTLENTLLPDQDMFTGDLRRIQQMLDNLLSNAIKFTGEGGSVNLRLRREKHVAILQVEDTGIGIPEAQLPLLFEKFQQLETGRQRQYPGTGLGLALTKQLAELHGGSITVNSKVGVGSVFTIRIPLQRLESGAGSKPAEPEVVPTKPVVGRIVLLEDREETASIICDLLTAADYQVIWVLEGSRMVEQVALLQPALVIVSVQLNDIDGRRIVQALRDSLVTTQVKILALGDRQRTPTAIPGTDAVITSPIEPETLLEKVNALVTASATG